MPRSISRYRKDAQRNIENLCQDLPRLIQDFHDLETKHLLCRVDGSVFQYTSYDTLRHMLGGNILRLGQSGPPFAEMWATSSLHLNDLEEFDRGKRVIEASLSILPTDNIAKALRQSMMNLDGLGVYCACFTAVGDDLSQWRGYGDNGAGVVIEYDLAHLLGGIDAVGHWVIYGKDGHYGEDRIQVRVAEQLIRYIYDTLINSLPPPVPLPVLSDIRSRLSLAWPGLLLAFKHSDFGAEQEFRMVYSNTSTNTTPVCFRGSPLVPFIKLAMRGGAHLPVKSIRLGPAIANDISLRSLQMALRELKLKGISVDVSSIPYVPK